MSNVGDYIKQKREEKKISVKQICDKTAIRMQHINLLEAGEFDSLPSYIHAHGFLEQYCKAIGLDFQNEVKPLFDQECQKATFGKTPEEVAMEQAEAKDAGKKARNATLIVIIVLLLLALAGFFVYTSLYQHNAVHISERTAVAPPSNLHDSNADILDTDNGDAAFTADNSTDTEQISAIQSSEQQDASARRRVVLAFTDTCWINFRPDNGPSEEFTATPNFEKVIYFTNYFRLDIGNAWALSVKYRDKTFSGLGGRGQVINNLYFVVDGNDVMTQQRTPPATVR